MDQQRVRLGELLVGANLITSEQLQEALVVQAEDGRKLGALLVETGYVTETQVTQVLSQQLSVPWVSLHHIDFSRQLLNLVCRELAERHCLIPIYVRRSRRQGETLYIAMDDPTDVEALAEVELYAGLPVKPMIAPPSDIRAAIRVYYGGEAPSSLPPRQDSNPPAARLSAPPTVRPKPESARVGSAPEITVTEETTTVPPPPETVDSDAPGATDMLPLEAPALLELSGPDPEPAPDLEEQGPVSAPILAREISMPSPKTDGSSVKMVTLTLLDGTQLNLPASGNASRKDAVPDEEAPSEMLTARDLVAALRAQAAGTDVSQVLGSEVSWQRVCAALLSVLLRKHLIADWEFVEELQR